MRYRPDDSWRVWLVRAVIIGGIGWVGYWAKSVDERLWSINARLASLEQSK